MAKTKRYRLNVGLTWPASAKDARRLKAGVPANTVRAEAGEIRDDIWPASLPWLIEQELVTPVTDEEAGDGEVRE